MGNTDEMLVRPASLEDFASQSSAPPKMWSVIRQIASATRSRLGEERLAWLRELPLTTIIPGLALLHATPQSCWRAPGAEASEGDLESCYGSLRTPVIAFGHTHVPMIRNLSGHSKLLINAGSVGLPYDGDPKASYLLLDGLTPTIRRVEYDVDRELRALSACGLPGADWTARMLRTSFPLMP